MSLDRILKEYEKRKEPVSLVLVQVKQGCYLTVLAVHVSIYESLGVPSWPRHLPQRHQAA